MLGTPGQQRLSGFLGEFISLPLTWVHIQKSGNPPVSNHPVPASCRQFYHNVVETVALIIWRNGVGDAAQLAVFA